MSDFVEELKNQTDWDPTFPLTKYQKDSYF